MPGGFESVGTFLNVADGPCLDRDEAYELSTRIIQRSALRANKKRCVGVFEVADRFGWCGQGQGGVQHVHQLAHVPLGHATLAVVFQQGLPVPLEARD